MKKRITFASLATALAAASVLVGVAAGRSAPARHAAAFPAAPLLSTSVHPPTFDDSKLFGIRNALISALKGHSLSSVNTFMVVNILATYWVAGKQGDAQAAKELGIAAHYEGPSQGQLSTQVSEYQTLASTGATGMFTSVIDPKSEGTIINNAVAKGLDVVAIDSPVPSNVHVLTYVGTPNITAGMAAGEAMKKALPHGGDVAILTGSLTAQNALQRIQGFKAALKGSMIKVTSTENDNGAAATASSNASAVIASSIPAQVGLAHPPNGVQGSESIRHSGVHRVPARWIPPVAQGGVVAIPRLVCHGRCSPRLIRR